MSANISKINNPSIASRRTWASWLNRLQASGNALLAHLTPAANVRLIHADGTASIWRVGDSPAPAENDVVARCEAWEIPDSLFLRRRLMLPRMSSQNTESALLLEVRNHSPFAADDLAWGFAVHEAAGPRQADVVIASRKQIEAFLQARTAIVVGEPSAYPEIWAVTGLRVPVVMKGYGEATRIQLSTKGRRWNYGLISLALVLACLVLVTPTAQLDLRAADATKSFATIMARAAPLIRKRDELLVLNDRLRSLEAVAADKVDVLAVMEYMTKVLPDDTYLYSLDVKSGKVVASGHTVDASALLQRLSSDPRLRDVKSPLAVTRQPGATKEAFTVEFSMVAATPSSVAAHSVVPVLPQGVQAAPGSQLPFKTGGAPK